MEELNKVRRDLRKKYIIGIIYIITILIVLIITTKNIVIMLGSIFLNNFIIIVLTSKLSNKYSSLYKREFVLKSLKSKFTDLFFRIDSGISINIIETIGMMYRGDIYRTEDYISGKYKDIKFEQSDINIESYNSSEEKYRTAFKGRWMIFNFDRELKYKIQIFQKGFSNLNVKKIEKLFKKVQVDSSSFNKKFNVYVQNENEKIYIILPFLMEKIEKISETSKCKVMFCFIDDKIHIVLDNNKDMFKPVSVFRKINEEEIIKEISAELDIITQVIDEIYSEQYLFNNDI